MKFSVESIEICLKYFNVLFFLSFSKNFWAWDRAWVLVLVSIYSWTSFQLFPYLIIASINFLCSSRPQRPIELPVSSSIILFFFNKGSGFLGGWFTGWTWSCNIQNKLQGTFGGIILLVFIIIFGSKFSLLSIFSSFISNFSSIFSISIFGSCCVWTIFIISLFCFSFSSFLCFFINFLDKDIFGWKCLVIKRFLFFGCCLVLVTLNLVNIFPFDDK